MTLERNGRFDVSVHKILLETDLKPETIFDCLLTIPNTSFTLKANSLYIKGQKGMQFFKWFHERFLRFFHRCLCFFCVASPLPIKLHSKSFFSIIKPSYSIVSNFSPVVHSITNFGFIANLTEGFAIHLEKTLEETIHFSFTR